MATDKLNIPIEEIQKIADIEQGDVIPVEKVDIPLDIIRRKLEKEELQDWIRYEY
jgi:hypothetical protein